MTAQLPSTEYTLEDLREIAYRGSYDDMQRNLARALLAVREQEPVAWQWQNHGQWHVTNDEERARDLAWDGVEVLPLYAHPAPSIHIDENSDFIKHIRKCSEEVSKWPEWKRNAADAMSAIDAPSIPVVPDGIQMRKALVWLDEVIQSNPGMKEPVTCRAAMLNGGKS